MTEDQLAVNQNAITLQGGNLDLDVLLPDINWFVHAPVSIEQQSDDFHRDVDFEDRPLQPGGQHVARAADITLATADDLNFDLDDPRYGYDLGPSDGIGSHDWDGLDIGVDFGDELQSVERGRDGPGSDAGLSIGSHLLGNGALEGDIDLMSNKSREASENPFGAEMNMDMDVDFGPDLGMDIDLGVGFGDLTPGQTRSPSRACKFLVVLLLLYVH